MNRATRANPLGNLRITPITIILGIIALCAVACFATQLFSFGSDDDDLTNDTRVEGGGDLDDDADNRDEDGNAPDLDRPAAEEPDVNANYDLGNVVTATSLDRDGCAVEEADTFDTDDSIYVVTEGSEIPAGTTIFVRLYKDNRAIEDAPEIVADQNYGNVCINFVFEPTSNEGFDSGEYEAEFFVNGNAAESVRFEVE